MHFLSWIEGVEHDVQGKNADDDKSFDPAKHAEVLVGSTYGPHVDKANMPSYDVSALLYLNTAGIDYDGGLFAFIDEDADRLIRPHAGMLVAFHSDFKNLHHVRPVAAGDRFVLSLWYRRVDA